jgi:hypothetical protein
MDFDLKKIDLSSIRSILSGLMSKDAVGMGNALQSSGSGPTQIPLGMENSYTPKDMSMSEFAAIKSMADGVGKAGESPDAPSRPKYQIDAPIPPVLMNRGEVPPISPVFGKQSLAQMDLDEQERMKMAKVLRGYV